MLGSSSVRPFTLWGADAMPWRAGRLWRDAPQRETEVLGQQWGTEACQQSRE